MIPYVINNGFEITEGGYSQESDDFKTHLAFSKLTTRVEAGQQAVIGTALNTITPCFGAEQDALILG